MGGFTDKSMWRAVFLEFLGTTIFLFIITAVLINETNIVAIAFAIGIAVAILAHVFGPISGAHFNPAITIGTFVTGDVGVIKAVLYITAQMVAGILGPTITYALNPAEKRGSLGNVQLGRGYSVTQGFFIEFILTGILVLAFLASSSSDNNRKDFGFANALAVGLAITLAQLVGIPYTGASINPARAFGPAVVGNVWHTYHWIYWLAPICAGIVVGLLYKYVIGVDIDVHDGTTNEHTPLNA